MLTFTEETGLREILNDLLDSDLFALSDTITKRLVRANNREDAIQSILSCIEKPSDVLKRQRVTKKVLFSYLLKVKTTVSPNLSKAELVISCLQEWKSIEECKTSDYNAVISPERAQNCVNWLSEFGIQFCEWYFPIFNELKDFGPEHFWADCKLMGELKIASEKKEAAVVGALEVANFLSSLILNDRYYFDANTSNNSVRTEQDPHGLVKITISGVVHQFSNCIGLFDSAIGLIRNPAYNDNWKIKWIHIKIHVTAPAKQIDMSVNCYPSICQKA